MDCLKNKADAKKAKEGAVREVALLAESEDDTFMACIDESSCLGNDIIILDGGFECTCGKQSVLCGSSAGTVECQAQQCSAK